MKKKFVGVNPKATSEAEAFYLQHFGSFRGGSIYALEALPQLLFGTWKELQEGARGFDVKAFEHIQRDVQVIRQFDLSFTGSTLKACMDTSEMTSFDRVTGDYFLYQDLLRRPKYRIVQSHDIQYSNMDRRTVLRVSESAAMVAERFGFAQDKRLLTGASYILSAFPDWCNSAISASEVEKYTNLATKLLRFEALTDPLLAGIVMFHRLSSAASKNLSLFSLASIEIATMSPLKKIKKVQASPRLSPAVGERFRELFPTTNAGFDFALTSFPRVYEQTLKLEIDPLFTQEDHATFMRLSEAHGIRLAQADMAGDSILWLVRQSEEQSELAQKVASLSPFGRVCLEVLVESTKKNYGF